MDGNLLGAGGRTTTRRARIALALAIGGLTTIALPGTASAETISDSASASISLDVTTTGSDTLAAFDPALGTLTQVDWTVSSNATAQLCIENLSATARSTTGFSMTADVTVTFPSGTTTSASVSQGIADVPLEVSNGVDDCLGGLGADDRFAGAVSAPDVLFTQAPGSASNGATITDPAVMAQFIGPGTVTFGYSSTSNAIAAQPSEWDIIFSAFGDYNVTVTYTYTPTAPSTTTTAPPGPTEPGETTTPTSAVTGSTPPPAPPPTPPGQLPATGSSDTGVIVVASVAIGAGLLLILGGRRRLMTHES